MYMRAVTYRIVYFGVLSVSILFGATVRHSAVQAAPASASLQAAALAVAPAALPTVTLATIHVSAVRRNGSLMLVQAIAPATAFAGPGDEGGGSSAADPATKLPSLRLDMPYYALGKLLPRVGKE